MSGGEGPDRAAALADALRAARTAGGWAAVARRARQALAEDPAGAAPIASVLSALLDEGPEDLAADDARELADVAARIRPTAPGYAWPVLWRVAEAAEGAVPHEELAGWWVDLAVQGAPLEQWAYLPWAVQVARDLDAGAVALRAEEVVPALRAARRAALDPWVTDRVEGTMALLSDLVDELPDGSPLLDATGLDALEPALRRQYRGEGRAAEEALLAALDVEEHPDARALLELDLVSAEFDMQRWASAAARARRLLGWAGARVGPGRLAALHERLGGVLQGLDDPEAAIGPLEEAVRIYVASAGDDSPHTAYARVNLAVPYLNLGELGRCAALLARARTVLGPLARSARPEDQRRYAHLVSTEAALAERRGAREEAEALRLDLFGIDIAYRGLPPHPILEVAHLRSTEPRPARLARLDALAAEAVERGGSGVTEGEARLAAAKILYEEMDTVADLEAARRLVDAAIVSFDEADEHLWLARALVLRAAVVAALGDLDAATDAALEAVALHDEQRYRYQWAQWRDSWLRGSEHATDVALHLAVLAGRAVDVAELIERARVQAVPVAAAVPGWGEDVGFTPLVDRRRIRLFPGGGGG